MRNKIGVIAALAAITARVGLPDGATAGGVDPTVVILQDRCEYYMNIDDRAVLQLELENLLELRPDDPCIPLIIDLLGGGPLAELVAAQAAENQPVIVSPDQNQAY